MPVYDSTSLLLSEHQTALPSNTTELVAASSSTSLSVPSDVSNTSESSTRKRQYEEISSSKDDVADIILENTQDVTESQEILALSLVELAQQRLPHKKCRLHDDDQIGAIVENSRTLDEATRELGINHTRLKRIVSKRFPHLLNKFRFKPRPYKQPITEEELQKFRKTAEESKTLIEAATKCRMHQSKFKKILSENYPHLLEKFRKKNKNASQQKIDQIRHLYLSGYNPHQISVMTHTKIGVCIYQTTKIAKTRQSLPL